MSQEIEGEKIRASIVIPAYQESASIISVLERIQESVTVSYECLIVVDFPEDSTVPYVKKFSEQHPQFRIAINDIARGPAYAIRKGFEIASAPTVVVTMADGSDDARVIDQIVRLVERGVYVAAASRYMPGGQQVGAEKLKSMLSKYAGKTLRWFAGVGTYDATNSFKAYNADFVRGVGIDSKHGFEIGLELTAKARRLRLPIAEVPTIWLERNVGESQFQVKKWLPHYLGWYGFAYGKSKSVDDLKSDVTKLNKLKNRIIKEK